MLSAFTLPLPQVDGSHRPTVLLISVAAVVIGVAAWFVPWHRWPARTSLLLLPVAFALISAGNYYANAQPYTYSVFFIVTFVWVGLSHNRWTSIPFLLPAAVCYTLPFALRGQATGSATASVLLVIPVCAFVAESIAWMAERERRSRDRSAALASVALAIGPHLGVDGLSQTLASEMRTMLAADRAVFMLVRDRRIESVFAAGVRPYEREQLAELTGQHLGDAPGLAELDAGRPVVVDDARHSSPLLDQPERLGIRSYMAVPVVVEGELRGVLACAERAHPRRYRPDDVRSAEALAAQARTALRNALLYERTLEAAQCDHLTGLGNRRAFHERLDAEVQRARRHDRSLSLLLVDVDRLKFVNDARGHIAGDAVLERVATLVHNSCRREDGVYRIGGDEFALVLPETSAEEASIVAERIRVGVERGRVAADATRDVTVSIGASSLPDHGLTVDELFERADTALYQVKRSGRNAVCAATSWEPAGAGVRFGIDVHAVIEKSLLVTAYQPIVDLSTQHVIGWEAFCRLDPAFGTAPTSTLFRAASMLGLTEPLDRACRAAAIDGAAGLDDHALLFVNVSPSALATREFDVDELVRVVHGAGLRSDQIVVEVTDHERVPAPLFVENMRACQSAGLRLSLDDFGDTATDLDVVASLPFDFVKIDVRVIRGDEDLRRRLVLGLLVVAREVGARLLAEGVETAAELGVVGDLGFEAAQGFFVHAPCARPVFERQALRV